MPHARPIPSYADQERVYIADRCEPLIFAARAGELELHAVGRHDYPGEKLSDNELVGLSSTGFWNAEHGQQWGLPEHRNEGIEFTFMDTGQVPVRVEGQSTTLHFGECLITRPWQPHQIGDPHVPTGRLIWLILDVGVRLPHQEWSWPSWIVLHPPDLEELTRCLRQNEQHCWKTSPEIRRCFQSLAYAVQQPIPAGHSAIIVSVNALLLALLEMFRSKSITLEESLTDSQRGVQVFLDDLRHCCGKSWGIESMAESCGLGTTRFAHHVKLLTNLTPAGYLTQCRLEYAQALLRQTPPVPIGNIARECGFSSGQYFATAFRKWTGLAPEEWRKTQA
ncbi:helix-turn-helix transcriptional regulator [Luteolibacter arcticus]|uniref:Helix-turn-helix transcriptional regulator n=1 Tax=Luteolibacter arcticus TaxID=1581411 RepID=A0ABT3GQE2_9BACT|nr:helix-turn-helix transcriptional regulator [Luteolibacter arcticus]MCW1925702.1 helix-turn-helix transcriptional regulator [Luteolibacter arcticus]